MPPNKSQKSRTPIGVHPSLDKEKDMSNQSDARKHIITFLGLAFSLSVIFWALILRAGSTRAGGGILTLGLMWCPGAAALITTLINQRNVRGLGWKFGHGRYLLLAYALPVVYGGVAYGIAWFTGLGAFTTQNVPAGQPLIAFLLTNATLVFLLGGVLPALGEEIGWRGLLVPQLATLTSFTNTALISGIIWAAWHLPLLLFSDYNSGTPVWYALTCFAALAIGLSFVLAWLRLRSKSLWPAVVLHASHNVWIQAILDPLTKNTGITPYITTEFGIALALGVIVVAFILGRRSLADNSSGYVAE
jgi:membrane protease YdiL (CAAX protease family)